MVAQSIDQLKHDWTDKYVVVDGERPELARFREVVGVVKTVNMSGRALVEFLDYHVNIGWYDIDLSFLKVVDKPEPKAKGEAKKPAKPAAKAPAAEAASPPKAKAAAKPAAGGKPSVADILAAARAGKAPATPVSGEPASAGGEPASPTKPAKPTPKPAAAPAGKIDRSKMSVADMIAMAKGGGGTVAAKAAPAEAAPAEEEAPAAAEAVPVPAKAKATPAASGEKFDKSKMSIDDMCDWCRQHDSK